VVSRPANNLNPIAARRHEWQEKRSSPPREIASVAKSASILVVEDAGGQSSLSTTLRTLGFIAFHAETVAEAMKLLECEAIDAIAVDVTLSDPDGSKHSGLRLLTDLRATGNHAHIPVLVLTVTLSSDDDQAFARKHGAEVHYKPQPYYELATHLNWLLNRK